MWIHARRLQQAQCLAGFLSLPKMPFQEIWLLRGARWAINYWTLIDHMPSGCVDKGATGGHYQLLLLVHDPLVRPFLFVLLLFAWVAKWTFSTQFLVLKREASANNNKFLKHHKLPPFTYRVLASPCKLRTIVNNFQKAKGEGTRSGKKGKKRGESEKLRCYLGS